MNYIQTIKTMNESIKKDGSIPDDEKQKAKELLKELAHLLAIY